MNLTQKAQDMVRDNMAMEDALPTRMPVYVNSVAYLFGVLALSSFVILVITGIILAVFGPDWYHLSPNGRFFNSMHFWTTQAFFASLLMHLTAKFFMGSWRDGRWFTWMAGMVTFAVAIFTALTGYLSQTNFDSQWISVQAKDAMNAVGVGAFFNTMNTGQVLTLHTAVLPTVVLLLVGLHILLVRRDGPVKPIEHPGEMVDPTVEDDLRWIATGERQPAPKPAAGNSRAAPPAQGKATK